MIHAFETSRLLLRKPTLADANALSEYFRDPIAREFIGPPIDDPTEIRTTLERWLSRWSVDGIGFFVIQRRSDGAVLGNTGFFVWDRRTWTPSTLAHAGEHAQLELGWTLIRRHWGNGYASEAARGALAWAHSTGHRSIISMIPAAHFRSVAVARSLEAVPGDVVQVEGKPAVVWRHLLNGLGKEGSAD